VSGEFDLFGDPVRLPSGLRGRPAHRPSQENRNKVMMLLAMGWSVERIAGAMHISQPSLRKHYFSELKARHIQRDRYDATRLMQVWRQCEAGNVGAMRLMEQLTQRNDAMLAAARVRRDDADDKPEPIGKKEAARRAAAAATESGGAWGDLLKPDVLHG